MPDVSIVVSVHNDAKYLQRTIWSLSDSSRFAGHQGVTTELVIVKDRADPSVQNVLDECDFSEFTNVVHLNVDVGSLGPCRNAGIEASHGKYVALSDADDMISYNMVLDMFVMAEQSDEKTIILPDWLMAFGGQYYLYRMFGFDRISKLSMFNTHPFISRVFMRREHALAIPLSDIPNQGAYAYEDWYHNCELTARGFDFLVCPNTVFFYRKKGTSMLTSVNSSSIKITPPSLFHEPDVFLENCSGDYEMYIRGEVSNPPDSLALYQSFVENPVCVEMCAAANFIDPSVDLRMVDAGTCFTNMQTDLDVPASYFRICKSLKGETYTDVFIMPFFTLGGAELYAINLIKALLLHKPDSRILMLFGQHIPSHNWLDRLPPQVKTIDIYEEAKGCSDAEIDLLTLRIIQTVAPQARIFLKSSSYAYRFFERYRSVLAEHESVMLRFCDSSHSFAGLPIVSGFDFNFLSENIDHLSLVVTDNQFIISRDTERLNVSNDKWQCVYSPNVLLTDSGETDIRFANAKKKVLWASRLDEQKRPELLLKIAQMLAIISPDIQIDVFGIPILDVFDIDFFSSQSNINFKGPFKAFSDIDYVSYDGFLYTSAFDGIPTIVLTALSAGMPLIAPRLGGLPEIVVDQVTGFLIDCNVSDEVSARSYCEAICKLVSDAGLRRRMGREALDLIFNQHSVETHRNRVAEVLHLVAAA